jgi:hypothetical protein
MLAGDVGLLGDFCDEVGSPVVKHRFPTARRALEVGNQKAASELAALLQSAGVEVKADGRGRQANADILASEFHKYPVEGIANGGGADGEGVAGCGRHEPCGVSKEKPPP